jgi:pimeloyl-ACP methyl ester carboxylesterase
MTEAIILADHAGAPLSHGKPKVNGVEIHYAAGGTGEPVFLLHGVPKTMSYWRRVVPPTWASTGSASRARTGARPSRTR